MNLEKNLQALEAGGQRLTLAWLREAPARAEVTESPAADGDTVLIVGGQSQASRRAPRQEARLWLEKQRAAGLLDDPQAELLLFGFGSPWPALLLLAHCRRLTVLEPEAAVVRAILIRHDFSPQLANPARGLTIISPWHLAAGWAPSSSRPLAHPPAQRREPAQWANLRKISGGRGPRLLPPPGRPLRVMVVPPLSGGSWPIAVSLAKAVETSGHEPLFLEWGQPLKLMELEARRAAPAEAARLTARLFEATGVQAAAEAARWRPDLVLSLAQAPLDANGLGRLREATDAVLAFWLVEDYRHFAYVPEVAPAYDAFFHIQEGLIEPALRAWGLGRAWPLPLAADPDLFQPLAEAPAASNPYAADLSFMGAGYPNRRRLLTSLAERYWPGTGRPLAAFKIFGSGWSGAGPELKRHLFEDGRRVTTAECALIYAGGLVNLNIHSSFEARPGFDPASVFVNPRTFEIAAAGSLQITDERPLLPALFEPGRELIALVDPESLPEAINHYLAHPDEARAVGRAARKRVLAEHTYKHRLTRLLSCLRSGL